MGISIGALYSLFNVLKAHNPILIILLSKDFFGTLKSKYLETLYLINAVKTGRTDSTFSEIMFLSLAFLIPAVILAYKNREMVNLRLIMLLSAFFIAMIVPPFVPAIGAVFLYYNECSNIVPLLLYDSMGLGHTSPLIFYYLIKRNILILRHWVLH